MSRLTPSYEDAQLKDAIVRSYFHLSPILSEYSYHDDCCFSPDGQVFAVNSNSNMISLYRCDGCQFECKIPNKKYGSSKMCFHNSKPAIYINSNNDINDHSARLLNIQNQSFIRYFSANGHTAPITSLCSKQNGVITASKDRTIKVWDDSQEKSVLTLEVNRAPNIALHPNGLCLTVTTDQALYIYDMRNLDNVVSTVKMITNNEVMPYFGMLGTKLAIVGPEFAQIYNASDLKFLCNLEMTMGKQIPGFSFTPDEEYALIPSNDYSILVADASNGLQVTVLSGHKSPVTSIAFSSAYHNFVTTAAECLFWTVDMPTYHCLLGQ